MKNIKPVFAAIALLLFISTKATSQPKPRYCKIVLNAVPFNYSAYSFQGLTGSPYTIKIVADSVHTLIASREMTVGENTVHPGDAYKEKSNDTIPLAVKTIPYGYKFDIIGVAGSYTIIKLWTYSSSKNDISYYDYLSQNPGTKPVNSRVGYYRLPAGSNAVLPLTDSVPKRLNDTKDYYLVKTDEMNSNSEEFEYKKGAWNVGLMYLPVKLRPFATSSGFFDFTSDFSLGTSFSYTLSHNVTTNWTSNFVAYLGVSSIKVDSLVAKDTSFSTTQNVTAFSPAIGFYWEKKGIQIGFVIGIDIPARNLQKTWVYRNMPWFSLSAGISIFKLTNNSSNESGNNSKPN